MHGLLAVEFRPELCKDPGAVGVWAAGAQQSAGGRALLLALVIHPCRSNAITVARGILGITERKNRGCITAWIRGRLSSRMGTTCIMECTSPSSSNQPEGFAAFDLAVEDLLHVGAVSLALPHHQRRVAARDGAGGHVATHHSAKSHHRTRADLAAGGEYGAGGDPGV